MASRKKASVKKKAGRPSGYTPAVARQICQRLADGESLRQICADKKMPGKSTVLRWLFDDDKPEFRDHYARAREAQAEGWADEILEIADDASNDWMIREGKDGEESWQLNGEHVQRSRVRIDSRKWLMSKLVPKKYGDKQHLDHTSSDGSMTPKSITAIDPAEAARQYRDIMAGNE